LADDLTRRAFLQTTAGAALSGLVGASTTMLSPAAAAAQTSEAASGDRIRFGIIGVGMQGSGLLKTAVGLPGTECVAACDLYDGRHTLAKEIAGAHIATTRRYHELLDNKDIRCLIVAVPDHWHKQVVVDALSAGKHVYCEKPMSHTIRDGEEMVKASKSTGHFVQVGSQRVSSALFLKARDLVAAGAIGELLSVELSLGRNDPSGAWEYPPPPGLSTENLDWETWQGTTPKKPFDPLSFARWRCWREYGTGVAGDLMVHLLSGMQCATSINQIPDRASAAGGIVRWKDGRDMPDLHMVIFEYGHVLVSVRLTLGTETPEMTRVMGSGGMIEISDQTLVHTPQPGIDQSPSYYDSSFPSQMRRDYERKWHEENDAKLAKLPMPQATTYHGESYDEVRPHMANFFESVRTGKPPLEDVVFGHNAAAACHMANESYFRGKPVTKEEALQSSGA
jgi:predicted dehydrogenase